MGIVKYLLSSLVSFYVVYFSIAIPQFGSFVYTAEGN